MNLFVPLARFLAKLLNSFVVTGWIYLKVLRPLYIIYILSAYDHVSTTHQSATILSPTADKQYAMLHTAYRKVHRNRARTIKTKHHANLIQFKRYSVDDAVGAVKKSI
jgi:hypothetical protein